MIITTFNRPKGTLEDTVALVRSRATTQPDIIAVQECRKPRADAHDHAWHTHHQHKGVGAAGTSLQVLNVLGDFNAHPCFGDAFFQITNTLRDDYGLVSAYHQRKVEQPFHIDYCFMSPTLLQGARVSVGTYDEWSADSDHRPLSVMFSRPGSATQTTHSPGGASEKAR